MTSAIRLVLFDLGGTLFHEVGPWPELYRRADEALWEVLKEAGVAPEARAVYGSSTNLIEHYYTLHRGDLSEPTIRAVLGQLLHGCGYDLPADKLRSAIGAMFKVTQANWELEEDALPTLSALRSAGFLMGAISNGSDDDNTQALIDKGGIRPYFEYILTSGTFGKRKPHPEIFLKALSYFGTPPSETVMIGDDYEADITGAQAAGMQSIWITRRVEAPVAIRAEGRPLAVVSALSEIPAILRNI